MPAVSLLIRRVRRGDLEKLLDHAVRCQWNGWEVSPRTVRGFALELGDRGLDPASQARILSTARAFFRWLWETRRLPRTRLGLAEPEAAQAASAFLTEGESQALLDLPPAVDFPRTPACWNCSTRRACASHGPGPSRTC
jgi:integrase/recombinase XerC